MLNSIATVSVSGALKAKLAAIADAGFEGVEIFENDLLTCPYPASTIGAIIRDQGLTCTAFQPFRDFEGMPPALRTRAFDRAERKFDVMEELGAELLIVSSNVSPEASADRNRIIDDFRELGERAAARGLKVGFEALAWGRHINDHREAWAVVRDVDHAAVGLVLDSFGSLARNVPMDSLRLIRADKIFHVQLADAPSLSMDAQSWSQHFRCMPGQGDLPIVAYVATLRDMGYDGVLSLEIFNDRFRAGSTSEIAVDGMRSLRYLLEQVEAGAAPDPRIACRNVEFIEFCSSEEEAPQLTSVLHALGFRPAGQHRRKAVTRWRQGDINVVVNCEPEGFAHNFGTVHGASVCAIGFRVDDAAAALKRARALDISSFSQAVGPGEIEIPAIRGVGGSLIYFVSDANVASIWETEFRALPPEAVDVDAGLKRVDHFTQSMRYEEMPSWQLYYTSLFAADKSPPVEIADPVGLTLSQPIQSADRQFRIVLNGSAASQTLASRFLHAYAGAGVQHIAFATDDIFRTADRLRAHGMEFLSIPPNYYADVAAQFGLSEERVARLAELNILYDQDATGEYYQLFTRAFAKRFFFEIVERRGYDGYGVANTPIRLAAQSRYRNLAPSTDLTHPPHHG